MDLVHSVSAEADALAMRDVFLRGIFQAVLSPLRM